VSDAPPKNSESLDGIVRAAAAAESLLRRGAREPALILYEELVRGCAGPGLEDVGALIAPAKRLERARHALRNSLHDALKAELDWARGVFARMKRFVAAVVAIGALAYALVFLLRSPTEISKGAHWTVSSASNGGGMSGDLPQRRFFYSIPNFFFHTNAEREPWLWIDLGRERSVTTVRITNRLDCCRDRARDIIVELADGAGFFQRSRQHPKEDRDFREWDVDFPPTKARFVRIRGTRDESLHLADVRAFGS
jgi:hypothetical protein